jgi:Tfp pilus assembly protein PilF
VGFGFKDITPWEYLCTQPGVILHYLRLSIWPAGLCLDYAWPVARSVRDIIPPAVALTVLVIAALWVGRRHRWVAFAAAWFFLILAPTSSIVPIRDPLVEHRMYLPLAAVILVIVAGVRSLVVLSVISCQLSVVASLLRRFVAPSLRRPCIEPALAAAAVIALCAATLARNRDYRSESAMWSDVVEKRPNNARGYLNLGSVAPTPQDALRAYQAAIRIRPDYADVHYNLGTVLARLGRTDQAVAAYREALRHDPQHESARFNLANALAGRGAVAESIAEYRRLLELYPQHAKALVNLGISLAGRGEMEAAVACFRRAAEADPEFADAHYNLGIALLQLGQLDEAIEAFRRVLEINPDHVPAQESLRGAQRQREG